MTIIKTASEAYAEHRQQIYNKEYEKAMYELAHQGCDKCPCCGKPNPKYPDNQQRFTYKQNHGIMTTYGKIDCYFCKECGSKWESEPFATKDFLADWALVIFVIISIISIFSLEIAIFVFLAIYCGPITGIILMTTSFIMMVFFLSATYERWETVNRKSSDYERLMNDYPLRGFHIIKE